MGGLIMNTGKIKEIGKWLMIVGGSVFSCGAGAYMIGNHIEKKEAKAEHTSKIYEIEEAAREEELRLRNDSIAASTEKDRLYSEKLKDMDSKAFAKFHADNVARANEDVMAKANQISKQAEADVVKARLECNESINNIREECLKKIEEANKMRDEAIKKYEAIDTLFTNKNKILEAKEALESVIEQDKQAKDDKAELLASIKDILG